MSSGAVANKRDPNGRAAEGGRVLTCFPVTKTTQFRLVGLNDDPTEPGKPNGQKKSDVRIGQLSRHLGFVRPIAHERGNQIIFEALNFNFRNHFKYLFI